MFANDTLLTSFLDQAASRTPDALAAQDATQELSYAGLRDASLRIAAVLIAEGVAPGDRVILTMPNSVAFAAVFWGITRTGAVAVPLNPGTPQSKFAFILGNCTPSAAIGQGPAAARLEAAMQDAGHEVPLLRDRLPELLDQRAPVPCVSPPAITDQDLAAIIYTSGSTGDPKGVMLSHLNMTSAARSVASYLGYRAEDKIFVAVPMTFDYGLHQVTMAALTGASFWAEPGFGQPLFGLQALARSKATAFPVVPTMVPLMAPLADRFDLSSVRLTSSTAAALHPALIDQLQASLPEATVFSMYGLTECHRCTYLPPEQLTTRRSSVGLAIPNTEMWVVDEDGQPQRRSATGELVIRGSTVMKGYWQNPEATAKRLRPGPWPGEQVLYTGDTCRLDDEGYLYFVGRSDDILKIGGEKVAPSEVEAALIAHDAVAETCVLGETHPVHGQICIAHVSLTQPNLVDPRALIDWAKTRLDSHAVPARIVIHDAMPRSQNGKLDRAALRAHNAPSARTAQPKPILTPAE